MAKGGLDHLRMAWKFTGGLGGYWSLHGNKYVIWRRHHAKMGFGYGADREDEGCNEVVSEINKEVRLATGGVH